MKDGVLFYDGATYELQAAELSDLLRRGVIVLDRESGYYTLAPDKVIDDVGPGAKVRSMFTGSVARAQQRPDMRSVAAGLKAPNGFGGRR